MGHGVAYASPHHVRNTPGSLPSSQNGEVTAMTAVPQDLVRGELGLLDAPGRAVLWNGHVEGTCPGGGHVSSPVSVDQASPPLGRGFPQSLQKPCRALNSPLIFWVSGAPSGTSALNSACGNGTGPLPGGILGRSGEAEEAQCKGGNSGASPCMVPSSGHLGSPPKEGTLSHVLS